MPTALLHSEKIGLRPYITYGAPNSIMAVDNLSERKKVIDLLGLVEYQQ